MRHSGAILLLVLAATTALAVAGCSRLNPDWCEEQATCGPDEYCDPRTNTCRRPEVPDAVPRLDADTDRDVDVDALPDVSGPDGPPDGGPDLPGPDLATPG